ncbi:hypothetical protein [Vibrio neonatus]|uniref:hypothetical protein n=1 Tax=Vibrio neonatus TaxID=278860 RepID=UPI0021C2AC35|nr:hypothetical protein [Vibrio neonatus]
MEVIIYNCNKGDEIERFQLSPYKMEMFLEQMHCESQCDICDNGVLIELYYAGRLTVAKRTRFTDSLKRTLEASKEAFA